MRITYTADNEEPNCLNCDCFCTGHDCWNCGQEQGWCFYRRTEEIQVSLQPTSCNLCGGKVIYTSNALIYGKEYGNGRCYLCTECGAYVSTHETRPKEAMGILANEQMRDMKKKCHALFDKQWITKLSYTEKQQARKRAYADLAEKLGISVDDCHFGYFNLNILTRAYEILKN